MSCLGNTFWLMIGALWLALSSPSYSNQFLPCHVVSKTNASQLVVTCRSMNLDMLPAHIFGERIVDLDLSGNHFKTLADHSFVGLIQTRKLNISKCGIEKISTNTFKGLDSLKELDMKNNPFLSRGLPPGIFDHLPQLQRLFISGSVIPTSQLADWGNLSSLTDIILTPRNNEDFTQLAALPRLRSVYFVFCNFSSGLNETMFQPFRHSKIKELALVACGIEEIKTGTFDGLHSLEVLNLAGNDELSIDSVIDALSSSNVSVTTLILDAVGSARHVFIGGLHDQSFCRPAWKAIKRLSARGVNLARLLGRFFRCFPNLEAVAIGFNAPPTICLQPTCRLEGMRLLIHLKYLDFSYGRISDTRILMALSGYYYWSSNWLLLNDDYFPEIEQFASQECHPEPEISISYVEHIELINFLPCLSYFKAEHWFFNAGVTPNRYILKFAENNLKYVQISSRVSVSGNNMVLNMVVLGLDRLTDLYLTDSRLMFANFDTFDNYKSLERLDLSGNILGKSKLPAFSTVPRLKYLSLANNGICSFRPDMFKRLISLRQLDLSKNDLTKLDFDLPPVLDQLDLSGNLMTEIDADIRLKLDSLPGLVLKMDSNPLQCDCPEVEFIKWFQQHSLLISNHGSVVCERGLQTYNINKINLSHLKTTCGLTINVIDIISSVCPLLIVVITSCLICYRWRWTLRWYCYKVRYKRRLGKQDVLLRMLQNDSDYSSFVIYPQEGDEATRFVYEILLPEVEEELGKPRLYIKDRDEYVGATCLDEMVRAILSSQTAIWIVCPDFFRDPYCEMAARFALHHLGPRKNLIVVLDNQFENYQEPQRFANLMNPTSRIRRVHFKEEGVARRVFSAKLDSFIPAFASNAN